MHRTRHASLDDVGNQLGESNWPDFLSRGMLALTTDDDVPPHAQDADKSHGHMHSYTSRFESGNKPRGGSMEDSLTSSTGSSPASSWRPLGRRVTTPTFSSNQFDRLPRPSSALQYGHPGHPQKLRQTNSFREFPHSHMSSSESSFYDSNSSNSSEDEYDPRHLTSRERRLSHLDVDSSYAEACLPVLTSLDSQGYDAPTLDRAHSLGHAKSPLLSTRKESKTWQMQDEELSNSSFSGSFHEKDPFGSAMGLLSETNSPREHLSRSRMKDARASSLDFTNDQPERNPPLPPSQEPLRLRARSFSTSTVNQHAIPPCPSHPPSPDYTMRNHPSNRSHPMNCPPEQSYQSYQQYGPPYMYRRYSTDAYSSPFDEEPESSRNFRSFSTDFGMDSSRQFRSQSMEGPLLHCDQYNWSQRDVPPAPPLPPDVRSSSRQRYSSSSPEAYYQVEFKRGRQEMFAGRAGFTPGAFVKVEADRGEDIGRLVERVDIRSLEEENRGKRVELPTKRVVTQASSREREVLKEQRREEQEVFEVCKSKVRQRLLPMNVIDAEYQFDRHKLTFFFEAERRIDFRELVRDLFAIYKTRIWLQQVVPGKREEAK